MSVSLDGGLSAKKQNFEVVLLSLLPLKSRRHDGLLNSLKFLHSLLLPCSDQLSGFLRPSLKRSLRSEECLENGFSSSTGFELLRSLPRGLKRAVSGLKIKPRRR